MVLLGLKGVKFCPPTDLLYLQGCATYGPRAASDPPAIFCGPPGLVRGKNNTMVCTPACASARIVAAVLK